MSELKKTLYIRLIFTTLALVLIGILLITIDGAKVVNILSIILGIVLIVFGILNIIETPKNNKGLVLAILQFILGVSLILNHTMIVSIISGVFLIGLPIIYITLSKKLWKETLMIQLPSLILGLLLITFGLGTLVDILFDILGYLSIVGGIVFFVLGIISLQKHE